MIPRRLIRTVPTATDDATEARWSRAADLLPGWELVTFRDPIDPADFPLTAGDWHRCQNGAQLAGLIRLEALHHLGGIYLDSDVELWRDLGPLLGATAFAGFEDPGVIPDAVLGAEAGTAAMRACLDLALHRLRSSSTEWRTGNGAWSTGPGVTTTVLPRYDYVLLLPPGSFYPVHYSDKVAGLADLATVRKANPWSFGAHLWNASWL